MQPKRESPEPALEGPSGVLFEFAALDRLETSEAKLLFAYWLAKRGDRLAPQRAEISPRDIPALLPSIHLYDVENEGRSFRIRVIGTRIVAAIGIDPTGKAVTANDSEPMYVRVFAGLSMAYRHRRAIRSLAERTAAPNRSFLGAENLVLPLSDDGATINKVMVCTIFKTPRELL